jgi:hypothetical protein
MILFYTSESVEGAAARINVETQDKELSRGRPLVHDNPFGANEAIPPLAT